MKKLVAAAAVLLLAGCASIPQVNRAAKSDKHIMPKKPAVMQAAPVEQTPNQIVKKRWYDRFKVHPKWFSK